jgi:broad specificity phosphatase PhoE
VFARRVAALLRWLAARPERSVALVSHWGVLRALTRGRDFDNCELRSLRLSQLLQGAQQGEQQEQRTAAS